MPTIRELQLFLLQVLKDVAKVCDENGIEYYIACGTLLGAVRHGGFIPWDDDIDIYMTVENYKKFNKIGQKALGDKYFVQNYKTEKLYTEMWTQIRVNGTTSMPDTDKNLRIHWGVCIDIFPLVGVYSDEKKQKRQLRAFNFNRILLSDSSLKAKGLPIEGKLKYLFLIPRPMRRIICRINENRFMLSLDGKEIAAEIWYKIPAFYSTDIFKSSTKVVFENNMFNTFSGTDKYLRIKYGDYMQLPPEEERHNHANSHRHILIDLNTDYRQYL